MAELTEDKARAIFTEFIKRRGPLELARILGATVIAMNTNQARVYNFPSETERQLYVIVLADNGYNFAGDTNGIIVKLGA